MRKRTIPIKLEKGKRKKGKEKKPHDGWDGLGKWHGLFVWEGIGIGIGRESTRRKEGITIRYEGSESESEWHE